MLTTMDLFDKRIRDSTELLVYEIWCQSLGSRDFTTQDNFLAIGGTSLAALRILALIREQFEVELSLGAILAFPTIERLAQHLRDGVTLPVRSYVPIRQGQDPTLALIHPLGGSIIWFSDLICMLPEDMNIVGLQAIALDPRSTPHKEIGTMARSYLAELLQEHKPIDLILVGYSFGGLIAYEMAHQLEQADEQPGGVILLDTIVPSPQDGKLKKSELLAKLVQSALNLPIDVDRLSSLTEEQICDEILEASKVTGALPPDYGPRRLRRLMEIYGINASAAFRYQLPKYEGPVHLVKSADEASASETDAIWQDRCDHLMIRHLGTGCHSTLISGDNAAPVAEYIQETWLCQGGSENRTKGGANNHGL